MDCVSAQRMIRAYLGGYLSDDDLKDFLNHVQNCPACFSELEVYYSVYCTLNSLNEKGDYNYAKKLSVKLNGSRDYLRKRFRTKAVKVCIVLMAECALGWGFWTMVTMPNGYLDKHRIEFISVSDTVPTDALTGQDEQDSELSGQEMMTSDEQASDAGAMDGQPSDPAGSGGQTSDTAAHGAAAPDGQAPGETTPDGQMPDAAAPDGQSSDAPLADGDAADPSAGQAADAADQGEQPQESTVKETWTQEASLQETWA